MIMEKSVSAKSARQFMIDPSSFPFLRIRIATVSVTNTKILNCYGISYQLLSVFCDYWPVRGERYPSPSHRLVCGNRVSRAEWPYVADAVTYSCPFTSFDDMDDNNDCTVLAAIPIDRDIHNRVSAKDLCFFEEIPFFKNKIFNKVKAPPSIVAFNRARQESYTEVITIYSFVLIKK